MGRNDDRHGWFVHGKLLTGAAKRTSVKRFVDVVPPLELPRHVAGPLALPAALSSSWILPADAPSDCRQRPPYAPIGVITSRYITPMTIGVVTLEIGVRQRHPTPLDRLELRRDDHPASVSDPPSRPRTVVVVGWPRHHAIPAKHEKRRPTVSPKRRPSAAVNRAGTPAAMPESPSIPVESPSRARTVRARERRCPSA